MLGLAGIELNFLHSSLYGAMYWTRDRKHNSILVITEQCKAFPVSHSACPAMWSRGWEAIHAGQLIPADQRDIPYHMALRSAISLGSSFPQVEIAWRLPGH